jgi:hypothetical protein
MNLSSVVLVVLLSTASCLASLEGPVPAAGEESADWVDMTPTHLQEYEHESYRGRDVYYVGGLWHYETAGRWAAYGQEPAALQALRTARVASDAAREERARVVLGH